MSDKLPSEVLVVEDEPLVRIVAADALADSGIMAWEAADAKEAFKVLDDHPRIGLIFTDVDMPGEMDGLDLAYELIRQKPDVEVIVTSGAGAVAETDIPDSGTFLPKPYRTDKLVALVHKKLDGDRSR